MSEEQQSRPGAKVVSRRAFLGMASAGLVTATLTSLAVDAQERGDIPRAENEQSAIKASDKQFSRLIIAFRKPLIVSNFPAADRLKSMNYEGFRSVGHSCIDIY